MSYAMAVSLYRVRQSSSMLRGLLNFYKQWKIALWCVVGLCLCFWLCGCAGAAAVINEIIEGATVLSTGGLSVLQLIEQLMGNTSLAAVIASIQTWTNKIVAGLQNIETLLQQYQTTPGESLLEEIEAAIALGISDIGQFSQIEGIPAALATTIQAWANLVLSQFESWASVVAAWKTSTASVPATASIEEHARAIHQPVSFTAPLSAKQLAAKIDQIFSTPTGDVEVDAALAKLQKQAA